VFEDTQGKVGATVAEPVNVVVAPTQACKLPVIVTPPEPIVTVAVFVQLSEFVYVIIVEPALTPVTTPVLETVATAGFEDSHALVVAGLPDPVNVVVLPIQVFKVPVIIGAAIMFIDTLEAGPSPQTDEQLTEYVLFVLKVAVVTLAPLNKNVLIPPVISDHLYNSVGAQPLADRFKVPDPQRDTDVAVVLAPGKSNTNAVTLALGLVQVPATHST
jgi:hypothetical protein